MLIVLRETVGFNVDNFEKVEAFPRKAPIRFAPNEFEASHLCLGIL